ncbi:hypothetical protein RHGRI_032477 [Rhododendron griersonianum]|uniref:TIR domain-containing protein n=1 Tax=Rhododendron griersonianum TaxID=479676 RepID=A0AAV6IBY1_9ERIC|nr:hypothetical protein RHGRI_032477 [Rhododendron griersonianum]
MFWKDGKPVQIIGGDLHYFRILPEYWEDRLLRAKKFGLNTIQTYVPWNLHEPSRGELDFEGIADIVSFLKLCQKLDLLVMCPSYASFCKLLSLLKVLEWDLGGFPPWLLAVEPALKLRSSDPAFLYLSSGDELSDCGCNLLENDLVLQMVALICQDGLDDTIRVSLKTPTHFCYYFNEKGKKTMVLGSRPCPPLRSQKIKKSFLPRVAESLRSSMASSSNSEFQGTYDIFLSFRSLDTRKKFTDHLYEALKREKFQTFRDDDEIERGEIIKSELKKAIENSRMSIIVLSKNYANSMACLFEIQTILEQWKTLDHMILPVFYEVDPLDIKEQAKNLDFGKKKVMTVEEVRGWRAGLKEVASMAGMGLDFGGKKVRVEEMRGWSAALKEVASMAGMVSGNLTDG